MMLGSEKTLSPEAEEAIDAILDELKSMNNPDYRPVSIWTYRCPFCRQKRSSSWDLNEHMTYCNGYLTHPDPDGAYKLKTAHMVRRIKDLAQELTDDLNERLKEDCI